jgi:group I intron endonuclease
MENIVTIGIYCLQFEGTDKVYIGQSKHIEKRFKEHLYALRLQQGSEKLQKAYNIFGPPTFSILIEETNEDNLNDLEINAIEVYNSYINGLNSTTGGTESVGGLAGLESSNLKYTKDQLLECFLLLTDPHTHKYIAEITNISISTVRDIATGRTHKWLQIEYPEIYADIKKANILRQSIRSSAKGKGIEYPEIMSPEGTVYKVENITKFASEHKICKAYLGKVLRRQRPSYKGWILA